MYTDIQLINLGLAKLSTVRVSTIYPARQPIEKHAAEGYPHWKRSELKRHDWLFAQRRARLARTDEEVRTDSKPYSYYKPEDWLKWVRRQDDEYEQIGPYVYSAYSASTQFEVLYIKDVPENEFEELFVNAFIWRIADEMRGMVSESMTSAEDINSRYQSAIAEARRANAIAELPQPYADDDAGFEWVRNRW